MATGPISYILESIEKKRELAGQKAITEILKEVLAPQSEGGVPRGASRDEIDSYLASQSMQPTPPPDTPMQAPGMKSMLPSLSGMPANPDSPPAYNPTFQTQGEASGLTADQIDPAKLGQELGLTQEVQKYKSGLQMLQQVANHPLFDKLQPGQAQKLIETITGITPSPMSEYQGANIDLEKQKLDQSGKISDYQQQQIDLQNRRQDLQDKLAETTQQRADIAQQTLEKNDAATQRRLEQQDKALELKEKQLNQYIELSDARVKELQGKSGDNSAYSSDLATYYKNSNMPGFNDDYRNKYFSYLATKYPEKSAELQRIIKPTRIGGNRTSTTPSPGSASTPDDKYKIGQTYKGYKYIGNSQWQKI